MLEAAGLTVHGLSLIKQVARTFKTVPETPWIFFSSRNAVRFYCETQKPLGHQKVGAVGQGTAVALRAHGIEVDFIGEGTDTQVIGQTFVKEVGTAKVLFPMAQASLRSIQKQFANADQVIDLVVYETLADTAVNLPNADRIVFTSPSNVKSFLNQQAIAEEAQVFAIGQSTAKSLHDAGIKTLILPWAPSELALADAVLSNA